MRPERWAALAVFLLAFVIAKGLIGAGTFLIDHFVLIFTGFWMTREIFSEPPPNNERHVRISLAVAVIGAMFLFQLALGNSVLRAWIILCAAAYGIGQCARGGAARAQNTRLTEFWRTLFVALAPLTVFGIWWGGATTYWQWKSAESVYLGAAPTWLIGMSDGNDFMWNGFLYPLLGFRIVPPELLPTHQSSLLTGWGFFLWLSQPFAFGLAILMGNAQAFFVRQMTPRQRLTATLIAAVAGLATSGIVIATTHFLVLSELSR